MDPTAQPTVPATAPAAPANNLTPKLTTAQLKQNIDALQKGGTKTADVQSYVNNYKSDGQGGFVLANAPAANPAAQATPTPAANPLAPAGSPEADVAGDAKDLVGDTNAHAANIVEDLSEKPSLAGASDVLGQVRGETDDIIGGLLKLGAQVTVPQPIREGITKAVSALVSAHAQQQANGQQPQNGVGAIVDKFQAQNPDLYKTIAGLGSAAAIGAGADEGPTLGETGQAMKAGASTAGDMVSDAAGAAKDAVTASPAQAAQKTLNGAIEDATPTYSKNLIGQSPIKNADGTITPRVQEGGTFNGRTITPTKLETEAGQALAKVPDYPTTGTALEKYQSIQPEIAKQGQALRTSLASEDVVRTRGEMMDIVKTAVNKVPDTSMVLAKSDPVIQNYLRVAKNAVGGTDQTLAGELEFSNKLDQAYENARGKLAFGSDRMSALDEIHTASRNALKEDLIASAKSTDVKASLKSQWDLYRAQDVLRDKAEAEAGNALGRFKQAHPIVTKTAKAVGRAAGIGAGVKLIP